jgi:DNA-binding protein HU-alpha
MATTKTDSGTTRKRAKAATKPTRAKSTAAKSVAATTKAPVQGVTTADVTAAPVVTKKELFTRLKARTPGVKGSDTRQVMEAMLDVLGEALVAGESIKAQPLGMVKVQRQKTAGGADMVVLKLRRKKPNPDGKDPLAEAAE